MLKQITKTVIIGVAFPVIVGIILLDGATVKSYISTFFQWIWSIIDSLWNMLFVSYSLPIWMWVIISIFTLIGLINVYIALRGNTHEPEYYSYKEDILHNVKWRWKWTQNNVNNLWCYCPRCDATLVYNDDSCHRMYEDCETHFICENCKHSRLSTISGDKEYVLSLIKREILRRIRTKEYKNQ